MNKFIKNLLVFTAFIFVFSPARALAAPGDLDTSFGIGGLVTTTFSGTSSSHAWEPAVQNDGKIVVIGEALSRYGNFGLARYNPDGSLDAAFGNGGTVVSTFKNYKNYLGAGGQTLGIQSDGKIVAGGLASYLYNEDLAVVRYNSNGTLDTSFGDGGRVTIDFTGELGDIANALAIQNDGKIVVGGQYGYKLSNGALVKDSALVRFNTDGSLDSSFGQSGKIMGGTGHLNRIEDIVFQSDGKIITAGQTLDGSSTSVIARYNTDGSLDTSFGNNGIVMTELGENIAGVVNSLLIQADDKLVAVGNATPIGYPTAPMLIRYNADGNLDVNFGNNGIGGLDNFGLTVSGAVSALQSDGKFILGGHTFDPSVSGNYWDFALLRYNSDGTLDTSFGNNGLGRADFGNYRELGRGVAVLADGRIVLVGDVAATSNSSPSFALVSFWGSDPNQVPTASAGPDLTGNEAEELVFDGSGSTDPDGVADIVDYAWDFGDGNLGVGVTASHVYSDSGIYTVTLTVTDAAGESDTDTAIVTILTPAESAQAVGSDIQDIINTYPNTPLSDKLDDALAKVNTAYYEIGNGNHDLAAGLGGIEGAVGDIQAAVDAGLLDQATGRQLMGDLTAVARQLAVDAINQALAISGDPVVIAEAQQYLADGNVYTDQYLYKEAVNKYKDALTKAESVI